MFEVFLIMRQLHEMLWYLTECLSLECAHSIQSELRTILERTEKLTRLSPKSIIELNVEAHRTNVNDLILQTSELVRTKYRYGQKAPSKRNKVSQGLDYFGSDIRKVNLRGANLEGACLIASDLRGVDLSGADLIGADMRGANISAANLANSIFLTQAQINTTKGESSTKLPISLVRPKQWSK